MIPRAFRDGVLLVLACALIVCSLGAMVALS